MVVAQPNTKDRFRTGHSYQKASEAEVSCSLEVSAFRRYVKEATFAFLGVEFRF